MKSIDGGLTRTQFYYNKVNFDLIKYSLRKIDWKTRLIGNTHESWSIFKSVLQDLEKQHVPLKQSHQKLEKPYGCLTELAN